MYVLTSLIIVISIIKESLTAKFARCFVIPSKSFQVSGEIHFYQENANSEVKIVGKIFGASQTHGFHIHEIPVYDGNCTNSGNDYNPLNNNHGAPSDKDRHVGDLGNFISNGKEIDINTSDKVISLYNEYSIIGKTCVFHFSFDSYSKGNDSLITGHGNSGVFTACGVVQNYYKFINYIFGFCMLIVPLSSLLYYSFIKN